VLKIVSLILLAFACAGFPSPRDSAAAAGSFPLAAVFSEDMITLSWADVPGAAAYNVYADLGRGPVKANFSEIRTRNRFGFLWIESDGKKERVVKGNRVRLYVVPLFVKERIPDTILAEGGPSRGVVNSYFAGFSQVLDAGGCNRILRLRQATERILPRAAQTTHKTFCGCYGRLAPDIDALYKSKIDPKDEGACVPFSTMVAKYFSAKGVPCYRAQGMFIGAFHSFNIVVVDSVEYVLDFTANQFVPESAPVFMPRDWCFIDSCGSPTGVPRGTFTKMYCVETVYASDQIAFTDTPKARQYQRLLDSLLTLKK
jgi:hypothetical protein